MRVIKVYEYSGGPINDWKLVAYHHIMLPEAYNDGHYREVGSFNAFFHNPKRIAKRLESTKNFVIRDTVDYDYHGRNYNIPEFRHLSMLDFFAHIGYNNKKKVFEK